MQHPKDVKGSDKSLPRNDGKFVLDGKRVEFSDYGGSSKTLSSLLYRLDDIVDVVGHLESDVSDLDGCYSDVVPRLDAIELEVEVMNKVVTKNALALCEIEERIAIMQEKIDGIN